MREEDLKILSTLRRLSYSISGIFLFFLSIKSLRRSISVLTPIFKGIFNGLSLSSINSLGFGWLTSYVILSGSPIAALGLNLFDSGIISSLSAFMMVEGSRFGAAFILVAIGIIEYLRGKSDLLDSISVALMTFVVTLLVFVPGIFVSYFIFNSPVVEFFKIGLPAFMVSTISYIFDPVVNLILNSLGASLAFFTSLGLLYLSLSVFDGAFKGIEMKEAKSSWINYMMRKPSFSFILGSLITLAAQSVSLSLGIIVPLYLRGYIQRRDLIPYIMGANLATFIDTFVVALILNNPIASEIVVAVVLGNLIVTLICLLFYNRFYDFTVDFVNYLLSEKKALLIFSLVLLMAPILLLLI